MESAYIEAINANPDDRFPQYVYADWLDEIGDPRGEAWRVLIEAGKSPQALGSLGFGWYYNEFVNDIPSGACGLWDVIDPNEAGMLSHLPPQDKIQPTFHDAMTAAAIAWVRCHRDAEFEPDLLHRS